MKFEWKVVLISVVLSFVFIGLFTYVSKLGQETYYVYQVGIYKEEKNCQKKMDEIVELGYKAYSYKKDGQYYVLSFITNQYQDIKSHSTKMKGIIKEYQVKKGTTIQELLDILKKGRSS